MKFKHLVLSSLFLLGIVSLSQSRENIWTNYEVPMPNAYISQGVYYSTRTNSTPSIAASIISSYPVIIEAVVIASVTPNSKLEIFDTVTTTDAAGVRQVFGWSGANTSQPAAFNVFCTSGMGIHNVGNIDAYIYWREK